MPDNQNPAPPARPTINLGLGFLIGILVLLLVPQDVLFREVLRPLAGLVVEGARLGAAYAAIGYEHVLAMYRRVRWHFRLWTAVCLGGAILFMWLAVEFNEPGSRTTSFVMALISGFLAGGYLFVLSWALTELVGIFSRLINGAGEAVAGTLHSIGRILSWFGLVRLNESGDRFILIAEPRVLRNEIKIATAKLAAGVTLSFVIFACFRHAWVIIALMGVWLLGLLSASLRRVTGNTSITGWKILDSLTLWVLGAVLIGIVVVGTFPSALTGASFAEVDAWMADPTAPSGWKALRLLLIPMILASLVLIGIAVFRGVGKDGKGKPYKSLALTLLGVAFLLGVFLYWNGTLKWEDFARDKGEVPKPVSRLYQKNFVRGGEQKVKEEIAAERLANARDSYVPGTGGTPSPAQIDRAMDTLDDAMSVGQVPPPRPVDREIQEVLDRPSGAYDSDADLLLKDLAATDD